MVPCSFHWQVHVWAKGLKANVEQSRASKIKQQAIMFMNWTFGNVSMHQPVVAKPVLAPRSTLTGRTGPKVHQGHGYVGEHGGTAHDMEETWEQTRNHAMNLNCDGSYRLAVSSCDCSGYPLTRLTQCAVEASVYCFVHTSAKQYIIFFFGICREMEKGPWNCHFKTHANSQENFGLC